MARGITITPYQPAGIRTPAVPGGGYIDANAGAGDFGLGVATGLQQLGAKGDNLAELVKQQEAKDNEVAALDIDNQYRQRVTMIMADPEKGFLARRGRDALDTYKDTQTQLATARDDLLALAKNDDQKRMLLRTLNARLDSATNTMDDHTMRQRQAYQDATYGATVEDGLAAAIGAPTDFDFMRELKASESARVKMLQGQGQGEEVVSNELRKLRGKAFKGRLELMMPRDPDAAMAWYDRNIGGFNPSDRDEIENKLKVYRDRRTVQDNAATIGAGGTINQGQASGPVRVTSGVVDGDPLAIPRQYADAVQGAAKTHGVPVGVLSSLFYNESRWNPGAVNPGDQRGTVNPATGKAYDSVGIGQWGEQYAKERGFDPRDANASINETAKVLREYADKYGGNFALARLAYGWGAGNVDKWLAGGGDQSKLPQGSQYWIGQGIAGKDGEAAKAATIALGPKLAGGVVLAAGGDAGGAADVTSTDFGKGGATPTPPAGGAAAAPQGPPIDPKTGKPTYEWQLAQADLIKNPDIRDATKARLRSEHASDEVVANERIKALGTEVLGAVIGQKLTRPDQIPVDKWAALTPEQLRSITAMMDHNAKGTDPPPNPTLYGELANQIRDDPDGFKNRDLVPLASQFPNADWKFFQNMQISMGKRDGSDEAKRASIAKGLAISADRLKSAGEYLGYTDSKGKVVSGHAKDIDDFKAAYQTALLKEMEAYSVANKKRPDDKAIDEMADRLLLQGHLQGTSGVMSRIGLGGGDDKVVYFQRPTGDNAPQIYIRYNDIPVATRAAFEKTMTQRAAGKAPSKAEVERAYTAYRLAGNR